MLVIMSCATCPPLTHLWGQGYGIPMSGRGHTVNSHVHNLHVDAYMGSARVENGDGRLASGIGKEQCGYHLLEPNSVAAHC